MRKGDWIQTYTGKQFYPLDPSSEEIDILDIAWSLSNQCRYNGHCRKFYSVAEHSVLVSFHVPERYALQGLLHDASEAYLLDVPKPIKHFLKGYAKIEEKLNIVIANRFGITYPFSEEVKFADTVILGNEMDALMLKPPAPWNISGARLRLSWNFGVPSKEANNMFIGRFQEIWRNEF